MADYHVHLLTTKGKQLWELSLIYDQFLHYFGNY